MPWHQSRIGTLTWDEVRLQQTMPSPSLLDPAANTIPAVPLGLPKSEFFTPSNIIPDTDPSTHQITCLIARPVSSIGRA